MPSCVVARSRRLGAGVDGARLAVKDAIAVAGVPLTGGSTVMQGLVPTQPNTAPSSSACSTLVEPSSA